MGNSFVQTSVLKTKSPRVLVVTNMTANLITAQQRVDQTMANADSKHVDQIQNSSNRVVNNDDVEAGSSPPLLAASSSDGSNPVANIANAVPTSSESYSSPDMENLVLVDAENHDLPTTQPVPGDVSDDDATYASLCDEIAESVVRSGGTFSEAKKWQRRWLSKVRIPESLNPGDRSKLSGDAKP